MTGQNQFVTGHDDRFQNAQRSDAFAQN
jgi:hypothetical protein